MIRTVTALRVSLPTIVLAAIVLTCRAREKKKRKGKNARFLLQLITASFADASRSTRLFTFPRLAFHFSLFPDSLFLDFASGSDRGA